MQIKLVRSAQWLAMLEVPEKRVQDRASDHRIVALDAMRGLAAFVVVLHHLRLAFDQTPPPWYLKPFFAGRQSVVLFFVLSGYVLSLPFWRGKQLPYQRYLVRRIFRIYVPYFAALLVALAASWRLLNAQLPLTPWFYQTWHTSWTPTLIVKQMLMGGGLELNTAFWSLRYEMRMSIVFPLLCWVMLSLRPWGAAIFGLAVASLGLMLNKAWLIWVSCFVFGAVLAWQHERIEGYYNRIPAVLKFLLLSLVIASYLSRNDVATALAACGVLIFARYSRAQRWLSTAVPEYLGRISYSMYLMHGTVLFATLILLYGRVWTPLICVIYLVLALVVSHLFCIFIEEPATRLGRRLTVRR